MAMVRGLELVMPVSRHRELDETVGVTGVFRTFPPFESISVLSAVAGKHTVCDDEVCAPREKRVDNSLLIVSRNTVLPSFSGTYPPESSSPIKQLSGCPADYNPAEPTPLSKFPALSIFDESALAWESLAATNPNVAHVSLPSYWAELKDLPLLWRTWGDKQLSKSDALWKQFIGSKNPVERKIAKRLRREAANKPLSLRDLKEYLSIAPKFNLWYRWGWCPLVSDIQKMFEFQEEAKRRLEWLTQLQSGNRVLKRRATLRNVVEIDPPETVQLKSVGANIQGRRVCHYTEKVWCVVNWKLATDEIIPGVGLEFDPLWRKAHELTFGLTSQDALTALWEIMPWSWFVDWFLHVQTVMDATKNTVPVTWGNICLMRHTTAKATVEPLSSSPDLSWCKPSCLHQQSGDRKQRLLVSPVLPFAPSMMPVFTTSQWSILGSLAVLKSVGR